MKADLVMQPQETAFLDKAFNDFGLSIDEFDHMDDIDIDYLIKEYSIFSINKKQYAQDLFMKMALCDGYVDPREKEMINIFV